MWYMEDLEFLQLAITSQALNVYKKDESGLNILMRAAIGHEGKPYEKAFQYIFNQQVKPYSAEEKMDGLEILGSSYIMNHEYSKGLDTWKKVVSLRSSPRTRLAETQFPVLSRQYMQPEWINYHDLVRMLPELTYGNQGVSNILYQAMLVRLRLCKPLREDVRRIAEFMSKRCFEFICYRLIILLLEWDESFASHSLRLRLKFNLLV